MNTRRTETSETKTQLTAEVVTGDKEMRGGGSTKHLGSLPSGESDKLTEGM